MVTEPLIPVLESPLMVPFSPLRPILPRPGAVRLLGALAIGMALAGCMGSRGPAPATMLSTAPHTGFAAAATGTGGLIPTPATATQPGAMASAGARSLELVEINAASVQTWGWAGADEAASGPWAYRLGVGDLVQLFVIDAPELTMAQTGAGAESGYRIESDGAIRVPFVGPVPAAGRTTEDLRADLTERLRRFMPRPVVEVRVTGFNASHASVVGAVPRPSRQPLGAAPLSAIDAINAAGGFRDGADLRGVTLIRDGQRRPVNVLAFMTEGRASHLPVLQNGDVVHVATLAERAEPARAILRGAGGMGGRALPLGNEPVSLAAAFRGGFSGPRADHTVYVLRRTPAGVRAHHLNGADAVNPAVGGRFMLEAGDMVVVQPGQSLAQAEHAARLNPYLRELP